MKLITFASLGAVAAASATTDCSSLTKKDCRQMGKDGGECMFARFKEDDGTKRKECVPNECSEMINMRTCKKSNKWGGDRNNCSWSRSQKKCCDGECPEVVEDCTEENLDGNWDYFFLGGEGELSRQAESDEKCKAIGCKLPNARTSGERAAIADVCESNRCWAAAMRGDDRKIRNSYGEGCELNEGWIDGEPNDAGGRENCVEVDTTSKLLNDNNCRSKSSSGTVCECEHCDETASTYDTMYDYFARSGLVTQAEADKICKDEGCRLPNARNKHERYMIRSTCETDGCWTSLMRDDAGTIRCNYGDGCIVAKGWADGEPNDYRGGEDCVELRTDTESMNDNRCDNTGTASTVCECDCWEDKSETFEYRAFGGTVNKNAAHQKCVDIGCSLPNARTAEERSKIAAVCSTDRCWTSAMRASDGEIKSSYGDGCPITSGWKAGEPNDWMGGEDCVEVDRSSHQMNDNDCNNSITASTVCQCEV